MAVARRTMLHSWGPGRVTPASDGLDRWTPRMRDGLGYVSECFDECCDLFLEAIGRPYSDCGQWCTEGRDCVNFYGGLLGRGHNGKVGVEHISRRLAGFRARAIEAFWTEKGGRDNGQGNKAQMGQDRGRVEDRGDGGIDG